MSSCFRGCLSQPGRMRLPLFTAGGAPPPARATLMPRIGFACPRLGMAAGATFLNTTLNAELAEHAEKCNHEDTKTRNVCGLSSCLRAFVVAFNTIKNF